MNNTKEYFAGGSSRHPGNDVGESTVCPFAARKEIDRMLIDNPNSYEPVRKFLDEESTAWRHGKPPEYSVVNLEYLKGKTKCHMKESLEMIVENAVKTWEMEASHKVRPEQWKTVVHDEYSVQANAGKKFGLEEAAERGNYNVLLDNADKKLYDAADENFESSHELFINAFETCFPWEVLDVFVGPPRIVFSWRHWGKFTGEYKANKGNGVLLEMEGFALVSVTEGLKITAIEVFYNPNQFLAALRGNAFVEEDTSLLKKEMIEKLLKTCCAELQCELKDRKTVAVDCVFEANGSSVTPEDDSFSKHWEVTDVFSDEAAKKVFAWKKPTDQTQGLAIIEMNESKSIKRFELFFKPPEVLPSI